MPAKDASHGTFALAWSASARETTEIGTMKICLTVYRFGSARRIACQQLVITLILQTLPGSHNAPKVVAKRLQDVRKYVHQMYALGEYVLQVRSLADTISRKFLGRG